MLQGSWREAQTKEVPLAHQDPKIFAIYEQLIYFEIIPIVDEEPMRWTTKKGPPARPVCEKPELCHKEYELLVRLYLLADYLMDAQAKQAAVDAIKAKVKHERDILRVEEPCMPPRSAIRTMWDETPNHCPGRQVLLDCFVFYACCKSVTRGLDGVPVEIKDEIIWNLVAYRRRPVNDMLYDSERRDIEAVKNGAVREAERKSAGSPKEDTMEPTVVIDAEESDGASEAESDETSETESVRTSDTEVTGRIEGSIEHGKMREVENKETVEMEKTAEVENLAEIEGYIGVNDSFLSHPPIPIMC